MGNSFTNINIHIIFRTKSSGLPIREEDLAEMFQYIGGIIRSLSGVAYMVGGRPDHIHILTSLPVAITVSELVRTIKSNSSKWIKDKHPAYQHFAWQEGYGAFSVSESNKQVVIDYISRQKAHHQKLTAQDEILIFMKKNGYTYESKKP